MKGARKIVSANYLNRRSPYRWLVRDADQPAEKAVAFKSVIASGVTFGPSTEHEQGFGCSTVAFCETAIGSEPEPKGKLLRFDGLDFRTGKHDDLVTKCETLHLGADGSMLVPEPVPVRSAKNRTHEKV